MSHIIIGKRDAVGRTGSIEWVGRGERGRQVVILPLAPLTLAPPLYNHSDTLRYLSHHQASVHYNYMIWSKAKLLILQSQSAKGWVDLSKWICRKAKCVYKKWCNLESNSARLDYVSSTTIHRHNEYRQLAKKPALRPNVIGFAEPITGSRNLKKSCFLEGWEIRGNNR